MSEKLVFFDLDHTLLNVNISFVFGKYLYEKGYLPFSKMLYCSSLYLYHKYFGLSLNQLQHRIFSAFFRGRQLSKIKLHVEEFLDKDFPALIYLPAYTALKTALSEKHQVTILSSSPDFLVEPIASYFGVKWRATKYLDDGEGILAEIKYVLDGQAKAEIVRNRAECLNIEMRNIFAYSDSYLDLSFLQAAGCPIVVNPDKKLLKHARQNNWPIL